MNEFHKILLVMDNAASKEIARTFVLFEEWGGDRKTTVTNCRFSCVVQSMCRADGKDKARQVPQY